MASDFFKRWSQRKLQEDDKQQTSLTNEATDMADDEEHVEEINAYASNTDVADDTAVRATDNAGGGAHVNEEEAHQTLTSVGEAPLEEPSVATLLSKGAETAVKKAALRKLFLSGEFSEVDALNDYDHDYSKVGNLTQEAAEKLRGWVKEKLEQPSEDEHQEVANQSQTVDEKEAPEEQLQHSEESNTESNEPRSEDIQPDSEMNETKYTT
ncbi:DUF3306 domain-containing protein [Vibrio sp. S9_S30]|uniref:DUF3306 domain-containing protein n=1 Tax=Vibrio sp. S9_S30 TaxID=2720226 RepID=UPI0016804C78|nr:DUF3306 domain-containing protein [Vibrio sp. S9_S30]